ncbi:MAG: OsmC family protein [Acidobacteriota bacterium]|nr:OsmC family protein [Acidobacteriota bacterium]HNQ81195.1 OsmC family protein [Candidatus Aminicenantes bacterium]MDD8010632.1 OsmC family protein [Acidobacteriota bacterium]MDD8028730.1 OsmC family protein [Acidobacteriota bacterium]MDD8032682.1 OsmC family protein [Acidobacteriota bacterium]
MSMAEELAARVIWKGKLEFEGRTDFGQPIAIDVPPPEGDDHGAKPMELLLISLASCAGQIIVSLLRKMRQDVRGFSLTAKGLKQAEHPRVFTSIRLDVLVSGPGLDPAAVDKALQLAEDKYCPVFAMLKKSVDIRTEITVSGVSDPPA